MQRLNITSKKLTVFKSVVIVFFKPALSRKVQIISFHILSEAGLLILLKQAKPSSRWKPTFYIPYTFPRKDNIYKPAYITIKYHKKNFNINPKCCLINSAKSELWKVAKNVVENINRTSEKSYTSNR